MNHGLSSRGRLGLFREVCRFALTSVVFLAAAGCSSSSHSISIEKQVWIEELGAKVEAVTRDSSGNLGIAGAWRSAWAVVTDAAGVVRWKYAEPEAQYPAGADVNQSRSIFHGVVALPNGNWLFCGDDGYPYRAAALIVIFDASGHVLERRTRFAPGEAEGGKASVENCFRWGDGVAVVGWRNDPSGGSGWLMRLDQNGNYQWTKAIPNGSPDHYLQELADQTLVGLGEVPDTSQSYVTLGKRSTSGELLQTSESVKSMVGLIPRSYDPSETIALLAFNIGESRPKLYTFDETLAAVAPPINLNAFNWQQGLGYRFPDGSMVLFGRAAGPAIGWFARDGSLLASASIGQTLESGVTFNDAVPLSEREFVAVASQNSYQSRTHGLFLTWFPLH